VQRFNLGWMGGREPDRQHAEHIVRSINLLSKTQLRSLFPDADITVERFFGFTKSLIVSSSLSVTTL
jgi:hypothetical protein